MIVQRAREEEIERLYQIIDEKVESVGALVMEVERLRTKIRLEDAIMVSGIAALEAIYANGKRSRVYSPEVYAEVERAVLALRQALTESA